MAAKRAAPLLEVDIDKLAGITPFAVELRYDLHAACSGRIKIQHRLIYQVLQADRVAKVIRMWSRYD